MVIDPMAAYRRVLVAISVWPATIASDTSTTALDHLRGADSRPCLTIPRVKCPDTAHSCGGDREPSPTDDQAIAAPVDPARPIGVWIIAVK
jgi:hypothetical protein